MALEAIRRVDALFDIERAINGLAAEGQPQEPARLRLPSR